MKGVAEERWGRMGLSPICAVSASVSSEVVVAGFCCCSGGTVDDVVDMRSWEKGTEIWFVWTLNFARRRRRRRSSRCYIVDRVHWLALWFYFLAYLCRSLSTEANAYLTNRLMMMLHLRL